MALRNLYETLKIDLLASGKQHYRDGKYIDALNDFTQAIKNDPKNIELFYYRGLAYTKLNIPGSAIFDFMYSLYEINNNQHTSERIRTELNSLLNQHTKNEIFKSIIDLKDAGQKLYLLKHCLESRNLLGQKFSQKHHPLLFSETFNIDKINQKIAEIASECTRDLPSHSTGSKIEIFENAHRNTEENNVTDYKIHPL